MQEQIDTELDGGIIETRTYEDGKLVEIRKKYPPYTSPRAKSNIAISGSFSGTER